MLVKDVFATQFDPLCRIMRRELRARGIGVHRVATVPTPPEQAFQPPGSMVFVPGAMGLMLAQAALETLLNPKGDHAQ
jgi:tRNA A37 threonylcarbamoyladenosine dehydratase